MADQPNIRVISFFQKVAKVAKRNEFGEKILDEKGNMILEKVTEDWCEYSPAHSPLYTATRERIRFLKPKPAELMTELERESKKHSFIAARWAQIEPYYLAWKEGHELPETGTPLAAWPGITPEQAEVFRQNRIRSVEDVASLSASAAERIRLPNVNELIGLAKAFLENAERSNRAERDAERDAKIEALTAQLAEMSANYAAATELLAEQQQAPARGRKAQQQEAAA